MFRQCALKFFGSKILDFNLLLFMLVFCQATTLNIFKSCCARFYTSAYRPHYKSNLLKLEDVGKDYTTPNEFHYG